MYGSVPTASESPFTSRRRLAASAEAGAHSSTASTMKLRRRIAQRLVVPCHGAQDKPDRHLGALPGEVDPVGLPGQHAVAVDLQLVAVLAVVDRVEDVHVACPGHRGGGLVDRP